MTDNAPMTLADAEEQAGAMLAFPLKMLADTQKEVERRVQNAIEPETRAGIGLGSVLRRAHRLVVSDRSCAELVEAAENGEKLSIQAAQRLAAELISRGQPLPKPLRRFAAKALRDGGVKSRRGRLAGEHTLRDLYLQTAWENLIRAGCDETIALEAIYNITIQGLDVMIARDRLVRILRSAPGIK